MVAKDRQSMSRKRAARHMEHTRQKLTRELIEIGNHEHEALGCSKRRGKGPSCQSTVQSAGHALLGLHLFDLHRRPKEIEAAVARPAFHRLCHPRGRRDGIDEGRIRERIGRLSRCRHAIHSLKLGFCRSRRCRRRGGRSLCHGASQEMRGRNECLPLVYTPQEVPSQGIRLPAWVKRNLRIYGR